MKRWIYFQPLKWREHQLMNFLVHQLMAHFGRAKISLLLRNTAIHGGSDSPYYIKT